MLLLPYAQSFFRVLGLTIYVCRTVAMSFTRTSRSRMPIQSDS